MDELFSANSLIRSEHYAETMENTVFPYLKTLETDEMVLGFEDKPLFTSRFACKDCTHGTVFIVHGFTENAYKYSELIYSFLQNGFSVVAYDQRGHGRSWRNEEISDLSLTHVQRFEKYEKDLECLCRCMEEKMPKPWTVFCHSMGGAVSALFMMRNPNTFQRAAMCAPMIAVNRRGLPFFTAKFLARAFTLAGKGRERMFVSSPYSEKEHFEGACATGKERFEWYSEVKHTHPEFQNNGPSYSWMLEALKVTQRLLSPTAPKKIACPVRIYSAEDDWEVLSIAQRLFVRGLKQGQLVTVPGSRHEIYRSDDGTLFKWWDDVLAFLKEA